MPIPGSRVDGCKRADALTAAWYINLLKNHALGAQQAPLNEAQSALTHGLARAQSQSASRRRQCSLAESAEVQKLSCLSAMLHD